MSTTLTDEQRARISENRRRALERIAQRQVERAVEPPSPISPIAKKSNMNGHVVHQMVMPTVEPTIASKTVKSNNRDQPKVLINPFTTMMNQPCTSKASFNPLNGYRAKVNVDMEVISPTEIRLKIKPYLDDIKNLIKSYQTAKYNSEEKKWTIGFADYKSLTQNLGTLKQIECTIKELPPWVDYIFMKQSVHNKFSNMPQEEIDTQVFNAKIESSLLKRLFSYQRAGVAFGLEKGGKLLIADEMGLGKSLQALSVARAYSSEWPLLIVCPASVKYAWKQQIHQFLPAVDNITVIEKSSDRLSTERSSNTIIIMSYDQMVNKEKELLAANIYVIIFDESHLLKAFKTRRTVVATSLSKIAQRRILLSGTPAMSRPAELFSQIRIVNPKIFPSWDKYADRYCEPRMTKFGRETRGAEHLDELSTILQHTVMIRRLKKDVLNDLPAKTRELLYLSGSKIQSQMKALKKLREAYDQAEHTGDEQQKKSRLMTYFAETGICKADSVADYILEKYFYKDAPPVKLLLFAHHSTVMDIFTSRFMMAGVKYIRIDGSTKGVDRETNCKRFQEQPEVMVAVLSITAAGTGITLTAANKVIFAELYWNPGIFFQAEDRAHRVGQKSAVYIQYILARDTADDVIWPKIQKKIMFTNFSGKAGSKVEKCVCSLSLPPTKCSD